MDVIWVIVNRLTKLVHFISIRATYSVSMLTRLYREQIDRLHGVRIEIVSDKDPIFNSTFRKSIQQ